MAKPLRPKRGTTAKNDAFVGLPSEITVDTDKHTIRVHDGVTAGGHALATDADLATVRATAEGALPKSGGEMNGAILATGDSLINKNNTSWVSVFGGSAVDCGASLELGGKDREHSKGHFNLRANAGSGKESVLNGQPGGHLYWDGKEVITSAGGTLNGDIRFQQGVIVRADDNSGLTIFGGMGADSAYIQVFGKDASGNNGCFNFVANEGATFKALRGEPSGALTWGGQAIESVNSITGNLLRFEGGLQICWGAASTASNNIATITFDAPFAQHPSISANVSGDTSTLFACLIRSISETGCTILTNDREGNKPNVGFRWTAIGRWK